MKFDIDKYHLKGLSFLDLLTSSDAMLAKKHMIRKEYKRGECLFNENSYSKGVYILRKGKVKIFQTGEHGRKSIVYFYHKGDFFGHRPILANEPNPVTAMAMEAVVVSFLPREALLRILNASDQLARELLINLSKEFSVWVNKLTLFTQFNLKKRVALTLLILHQVYKRKDQVAQKVRISIGRDDFAGYVGTAKETLVRMLRYFKDEKIITSSGTAIYVLNPVALNALLEEL